MSKIIISNQKWLNDFFYTNAVKIAIEDAVSEQLAVSNGAVKKTFLLMSAFLSSF